jgi:PAS domain S-box-containing protein
MAPEALMRRSWRGRRRTPVTYANGALLIVVGMQAAMIVALLLELMRRSRAEQALRASGERFRLIADRAPVMIWTARPDTTLDYLNSTCVEFTGLPLEKLRDQGWLDAVHPEDRDYCTSIYVPAVEARRPFTMEYRIRRADGVGDGSWTRAFRSTARTGPTPDSSAAASTSPHARLPKNGPARVGRPSRPAIGRCGILPAG